MLIERLCVRARAIGAAAAAAAFAHTRGYVCFYNAIYIHKGALGRQVGFSHFPLDCIDPFTAHCLQRVRARDKSCTADAVRIVYIYIYIIHRAKTSREGLKINRQSQQHRISRQCKLHLHCSIA